MTEEIGNGGVCERGPAGLSAGAAGHFFPGSARQQIFPNLPGQVPGQCVKDLRQNQPLPLQPRPALAQDDRV